MADAACHAHDRAMKSDRGHTSTGNTLPDVHVVLVTDASPESSGYFACLTSHKCPHFIVHATPSTRAQTVLRHDDADVCILDVAPETRTDVPLAKTIHEAHPELPLVIVTSRPDPLLASRALRAGALGYLSHEDPPSHLVSAVLQAKDRKRFVSETIMQGILLSMNEQPPLDDVRPHERNEKGRTSRTDS